MRVGLKGLFLAAGLVAGAALAAEAQTSRPHLGAHVGYNTDIEDALVGAQLSLPVARYLEFYPSFTWYLVDPGSLWALNADLKYRIAGQRAAWFYTGAGLNILRRSFGGTGDSEAGLNLLLGVESLRGPIHPFLEGRLTLADQSMFQLQGGLNITLGRH